MLQTQKKFKTPKKNLQKKKNPKPERGVGGGGGGVVKQWSAWGSILDSEISYTGNFFFYEISKPIFHVTILSLFRKMVWPDIFWKYNIEDFKQSDCYSGLLQIVTNHRTFTNSNQSQNFYK